MIILLHVEHKEWAMEAEINSFTRKSKRYRTKYLDELGKLFGQVKEVNKNPTEGVKYEQGKEFTVKSCRTIGK